MPEMGGDFSGGMTILQILSENGIIFQPSEMELCFNSVPYSAGLGVQESLDPCQLGFQWGRKSRQPMDDCHSMWCMLWYRGRFHGGSSMGESHTFEVVIRCAQAHWSNVGQNITKKMMMVMRRRLACCTRERELSLDLDEQESELLSIFVCFEFS
ncbi:hypothetical protein CK203_025374 [Vitis vinifera]|uniref:Uncharacterized protein n=1 Tax=Vitis vinifera TaxID=29760 RepID=A0A438IZ98_VITVI|nr:hypothetical protein CK203_025374 [Vitis vinifera]